MKRRGFVKNVSFASMSVPFMLNNMPFKTINDELFFVPKNFEDRVLVIIRLNGGNDGLNTVIPLDQYDKLVNQRQNIIIPENQIIPIGGNNGFHPVMTGMANMYQHGKLSIIQNVGYPEQNRSHFRSMDIWTSGMMDPSVTTGWLGRHFDIDHPNYPTGYPNNDYKDPFAISLGFEVSATCQGMMANFSHSVTNPFNNSNLPNSSATNDGTYYGSHMEYLTGIIAQTNAYGSQINTAANAGNSLSQLYDPNNPLATQLKYVAQMISGGLKTKVYILNVNGYDTHDSQVTQNDTTQGVHANLMKRVSDAIYAFQDDLALLGLEQRVAGMTFSEFGRQIASNASFGTDHGDAAPLFLFGGCINGAVLGDNPIIPDQVVDQAGLPMSIDFRDVYASVLKDWFGVEEARIQSMFEHEVTFLNILGACNLSTNELSNKKPTSIVYPNPCGNQATLKFEAKGSWTKINIIDLNGRVVKSIYDGNLAPETHHIPLDLSELNNGSYRIAIQSNGNSETLQLLKLKSH
jgi:uncharacterized protein (DUF1501 family)